MYFTCYDLSGIRPYRNETKSVNKESELLLKFNEKIKSSKFDKKWQVKTNHEIIKEVAFIPEENILCTSSYDKKIKIWNSQTGEHIDSLQQSYNKSIPEPIAYYDTRRFLLIAKNKKETIDNININLFGIQSNPMKLR